MSIGGENIPSGIEPTSSQTMEDIKKDLFKNTMKGKWNEVLEICRKRPEAHMCKITWSGETALHIAISENKEETVKELIKLIVGQPNGKDAPKIQNKRGNTPLHFAATLGSVEMCRHIVEADSLSVGVSNSKGETPYFVAASHGKKAAFLYLHGICHTNVAYARRSDGDSILHITIDRDHFDLALQIIHLYEKMLVDSINQEGMLPLHQLASKPSAFRSGHQMNHWKKIIYNCISVDELNVEISYQQSMNKMNQNNEENLNNQKCPNYTKICTLCIKLLSFFRNMVQAVTSFKCKRQQDLENPERARHQGSHGPNFSFAKRAVEDMLIVLGLGLTAVGKMRNAKTKHTRALQIMDKLLELTSMYEDEVTTGRSPQRDEAQAKDETTPYHFEDYQVKMANIDQRSTGEGQNIKKHKRLHGETPLLLAAKHGIIEIVKKILKEFPIAKYDRDEDMKNIVLLAAEHRQPHVYQFLLEKSIKTDSLFQKVDKNGNSALHLAAKHGVYKPWKVTRAALQMQLEFKWYEFVRQSIPPEFHPHNNDGETPKEVFSKTHEDLIKDGGEWLTKTSESCSVVAALIATVAFATSSSVPGGVKEKSGTPTLENQPAFAVFAIASLVALCFSVMALILFLAILTSRYREKDFGKQLPKRLLIGLTSLFISIASVLASFCAGHFFVLKDKLKYAAIPVYAVTCLPATYFVVLELPLYFDVIFATFKKIPKRSREVVEF